jgi:hypothetical protein
MGKIELTRLEEYSEALSEFFRENPKPKYEKKEIIEFISKIFFSNKLNIDKDLQDRYLWIILDHYVSQKNLTLIFDIDGTFKLNISKESKEKKVPISELSSEILNKLANDGYIFIIDFNKYKGCSFDFTSSGTGIYLFNEKPKNTFDELNEIIEKNGFIIRIDKFTIVPIPKK